MRGPQNLFSGLLGAGVSDTPGRNVCFDTVAGAVQEFLVVYLHSFPF